MPMPRRDRGAPAKDRRALPVASFVFFALPMSKTIFLVLSAAPGVFAASAPVFFALFLLPFLHFLGI